MTILNVVSVLLFFSLLIFFACLGIGRWYATADKWLAVLAETLSLTAAVLGGTVIFHLISEREEALSQISYRSSLHFAYETNLYCRALSQHQYSSAIADSCAVVDAAFKASFSPMPEHDRDYWQRSMDSVLANLRTVVNRRPPRESPTSPVDKEIIETAMRSLQPDAGRYKPITNLV